MTFTPIFDLIVLGVGSWELGVDKALGHNPHISYAVVPSTAGRTLMPETGRLELDILDVYGMRLSEPVTVSLRHRTLQERRRADRVDVSHPIAIGELRCE